MKLRELLSKVTENKRNGQLVTCFKKNKMKKAGISTKQLLDMKIDSKLKLLFTED